MRAYIAPILERKHGADWIRSQVLNDAARERNLNSYTRREQSLKRGVPSQNLIDFADIPFLIQENRDAFPDSDTRQMHMIRDLRNAIHHPDRTGDCSPEEAASIAGLCTLVVERCGLSDVAEDIRRLSSDGPSGGPSTSEADLRKQQAHRDWDKKRLASKPFEELAPWEQQRLADIEFEEEWDRRELVRNELEEITKFGNDIDGLRLWFDADEARNDRHPSEHAALLRREQRRREQQERERAERERRERERREQQERERAERERRERERREQQERERELRERERTEIAAFGDDIDGLRRWFDTYKVRTKRHPSEYAALLQRERKRQEQQAHERRERERLERERREKERQRRALERIERERTEIAAFGDNVEDLSRWFDADKARHDRHPSVHATLLRRERERERAKRERELREREQTEIAAFGDDIDGLRRWFGKYKVRPKRHPSEYATLLQREQQERERAQREKMERERTEIAAFGGDIEGLRGWFHALADRRYLHPTEYTRLVTQEQEREQARRKRIERERTEIAAFGGDIEGLRGWFGALADRRNLHLTEYTRLVSQERAALLQQERVEREQVELRDFGNDIDGLRRWFDANTDRQQRHASAYVELERRERNWLNVARRRLASLRAKKNRGKPVARQLGGLFARSLARGKPAARRLGGFFARSLAVRAGAILAISFVLIYVVAVARYEWPLVAGLEFAAMIWAATLPGLALAGHASYRFRTAYAVAADEKTRRGLWNALLMEALSILAVSVLLICVPIGVWYGWWLEPGFAVELGAAAIPGLVLAGHTGYRFRTANDGSVTAKNSHSPAFLSKGILYLLIALGLLALGVVIFILSTAFSESKDKKG